MSSSGREGSEKDGLSAEAFVRESREAPWLGKKEPGPGKVVVRVTMPPSTLVRTGPGRYAFLELSDRLRRMLEEGG